VSTRPHPELPAEQSYVDYAYECLDRMRERVLRATDAAATEFAADALDAWSARTLESYADAERGICFGRLDLEESPAAPLYVGRRWVHDGDHDVVVVNWQAPAAQRFYTATPVEPQRVSRRRRFRLDGRRVAEIADEVLGGTLDDEPAPLGDFLLEELQRSREEHMRDIVATIQADQYRLITADLDGVLVVQGGPGTGKTAVSLHRASWLLYTHRRRLAREGVLVVGPNRTFIEYVSQVLPSLGETSVVQRAVGDLRDGTEPGRRDAPEAERVKGDLRVAEVLRRAVESHLRPPADQLAGFLEGTEVRVYPDRIAELVAEARAEAPTYAAGRERLQMKLLRAFYEGYGRKLGLGATRSFDEIERGLRRGGYLQRFVDGIWPSLDSEKLLGRMLTDASCLAEAATGVLGADEQRALLRPRRDARRWSESDVPLLDELDELLAGRPRSFGHVIVDEAQDLTPMQIRMIARRAPSGSLTVLGDIAQATGPFPYERWDEPLAQLAADGAADVEELVLAYRVPAEIMALALPLLPLIAPAVRPPVSYRPGGRGPRFLEVEPASLARVAAQEAVLLDAGEGTVAVIAPVSLAETVSDVLDHASVDWLHVLAPRKAKGLEFDHVVAVEPALVVDEAPGIQGLRHLYVALTRATQTLTVVHARPLPEELAA
jgi:DNA helicase IV